MLLLPLPLLLLPRSLEEGGDVVGGEERLELRGESATTGFEGGFTIANQGQDSMQPSLC
jgi:hypothetical protein